MRKLTREQAEELVKCRDDVVHFVVNHCWLKHTSKGKIKWDRPYVYQVELLEALQRNEDIFVCKSRRIGASWTCCAFALWRAIFHPDITIMLLSRKEFYAKGLLRRIKFMLKNLPMFLRPKFGVNAQTEISFIFRAKDEFSESNIVSLTTTDESGRGEDAALILMDEAAFIPKCEETWAAVGPTGAFGGQRVVISTPNGVGNFFHRNVELLRAGIDTGFSYLEAHWKRDCGLSDAWFKKATAGLSTQKILQEFELVFLSAGAPFFDLVQLGKCYKPPEKFPEVAALMYKTEMNFSGVDSSKGHIKSDGAEPDFHSIVTLNELAIQIFAWHDNKMSLNDFAGYTAQLDDGSLVEMEGVPTKVHREYPGAMVIETFGTGDVVMNRHKVPDDTRSYVVAKQTTSSRKNRILNSLRLAINELAIIITDDFTYRCLLSFEDQTSGVIQKAGAAKGAFDDPVIALAEAHSEWRKWGGYQFDLTAIGKNTGKRMIALKREDDLSPSDLHKILPVGTITRGPIVDRGREVPGDRRLSDGFFDVRLGKGLPPPGM